MKYLLTFLMCLIFATTAIGAEVLLSWDPSRGAMGYTVQYSLDAGMTWTDPIDVGEVVRYRVTELPGDQLILFRVGAYDTQDMVTNMWSGAWYDGSKRPALRPGGARVK